MSVQIHLSRFLKNEQNNPAFKRVADAFIEYKTTGDPGKLFGRDKVTDRPRLALQEKMKHLHILDEKTFKLNKLYLKSQDYRHSDTMLFYCSGAIFDDHYLLIGIVWENAHDFMENEHTILWNYALEAEEFRMKW
ncbi:type II toxin-antitoxin system YafO family toxin [Hahella chejuensis]|uniref:type II toxin-antitoxin system YafO family toxin n=1 Tax=Hahella chejuensis TaxID=158327 RepID=UPI0006748C6A|nr:type II toxin-antitoxin system YafO family toxin [Hahella chejuensis]